MAILRVSPSLGGGHAFGHATIAMTDSPLRDPLTLLVALLTATSIGVAAPLGERTSIPSVDLVATWRQYAGALPSWLDRETPTAGWLGTADAHHKTARSAKRRLAQREG
jgi:hypothetical protein